MLLTLWEILIIKMLAVPILLVLIIWSLIICLKWKKNIFDVMEKMPGMKWYPFVGTFYTIAKASRADVFYEFANVTLKHKPFYRSWNGWVNEVHIMKPDHLQILLKSSTHAPKGPFYQYLYPWLGEGVFISEGAKWFLQRKLLTPTFHFKILEGFIETFGEKGAILTKNLEAKANGEYFNIVPDIATCTLSVICETSMGVPLNAITDKPLEYVKNVHDITEVAMWRYWKPHIIDPIFYLLPEGRKYRRLIKDLHAFSDKVISYRKSLLRNGSEIRKKSFLDLVLDATENQNILSDSDLKALADTFLLAGYETTSTTIGWILFLLGNHPEIQERAYEEAQSVFGGKDAPTSLAEVNELKYIECIVKESLRIYPILPFITRKLTEDIIIDGYTIPAGTQAIAHILLLHRSADNYEDPLKFDPERFTPENSKNRHPFAYIPFSAGPRNCLGMRFALLELKTMIATMVNKFKITSMEKPEDVKLFAHFMIRPQSGINVKLEKRN